MSGEVNLQEIVICTQTYPRFRGDVNAPFLHNLAKSFAKKRNVTVVAPHHRMAKEKETVDGVSIQRFRYARDQREILAYTGSMHKVALKPWNWWLAKRFMSRASHSVRQALDTTKSEILYAHWLVPTGMFAKKALRGETFFAHVHGTDFHLMQKYGFIKKVARRVLSNVDGVICVSNEQAEVVKSMTTAPVFVQAMGIDLEMFHAKERTVFSKNALFVGRITEAKGVQQVIETAKLTPDWNFKIIGDGPDLNQMKSIGKGVENLEFVGAVENNALPEYYRKASAFILPSTREGMPVSILEALACGVPTITTDVGQITEIISDKENGFLVEGDAWSIQNSLHQLEQSDLWANMSKRASESVLKSGLDSATDNILTFMQKIHQSKSTKIVKSTR